MPTLINVKTSILKTMGYKVFLDWYAKEDTEYIGEGIEYSELGKIRSKWENPFYYARGISEQTCLELQQV